MKEALFETIHLVNQGLVLTGIAWLILIALRPRLAILLPGEVTTQTRVFQSLLPGIGIFASLCFSLPWLLGALSLRGEPWRTASLQSHLLGSMLLTAILLVDAAFSICFHAKLMSTARLTWAGMDPVERVAFGSAFVLFFHLIPALICYTYLSRGLVTALFSLAPLNTFLIGVFLYRIIGARMKKGGRAGPGVLIALGLATLAYFALALGLGRGASLDNLSLNQDSLYYLSPAYLSAVALFFWAAGGPRKAKPVAQQLSELTPRS